jgi:hypothetical protein
MVFGNNLIEFGAKSVSEVKLPEPVSIGEVPKKVVRQPIVVSKSIPPHSWTFEVNWANGSWSGCGPKDENGNDVEWGVCVSYPDSEYTEKQIEKKLMETMEKGIGVIEAQKEYEKNLALWQQDKATCEAKVKEGSVFTFVNKERLNATGPITEEWMCLETITPVEEEEDEESVATPAEEEEEEEDEVSTTTTSTQSSSGNNIEVGFGSGFKDLLNKGLMAIVVIGIGYGAFKVEERTSIFSKLASKIMPKKEASSEGKNKTPQKKPQNTT